MLSLNASDPTAFRVHPSQVSQQPGSLANGTHVPPLLYSSPSPTASIVWVNTLWLLSLVFSLTSALSALLMRQWSRKYTELPHIPSLSCERARVRSFLFLGTIKYEMHLAVEMIPMLLHLSAFLFLVGLVIFFYPIHKTIAIVLSISVGLLGVAYLTLTILPCVYRNCPYRTPMSGIFWCLWHTFAFLVVFCLQWILRRLHALLVPYNLGDVKSPRQRKLTEWLEGIENVLNNHRQCLRDGFQDSIVRVALDAPEIVDLKALAWLLKLPALAEKSKIQNFIANTPGETIVQLMNVPAGSGRSIFRDHLFALLRSCAPGTVGLDEDMRRSRLLVCLDAVHRIVKASSANYGVSPSESVLSDVRTNFANMGLMRALWADTDPAIRLVSRSICALLARHLLLRPNGREEPELDWLKEVVGSPPNAGDNYFDDIVTVDRMNLKSFVYGVLSIQTDKLSSKDATVFAETLAILMNAGGRTSLSRDIFEEQLTAFVHWTENDDDKHRDEVIGKLRDMLQAFKRHSEQQRRNTM